MKCENCGSEFFNSCVNCGRENHTKNNRCDKCLYVVELNIKQDKKIRNEGLPIPNNWNKIMSESLNPDILCPDCILGRTKKMDDRVKRFWVRFRRDHPV